MTIIVFVVDTSASMNQRAYVCGRRITLIDLAKECVETFLRFRRRNSESSGDRVMLLTCNEYPSSIKSGWKDNLETFTRQLNNLQCDGLTNLRNGLTSCFTLLNLNRMQTGIDNYGQGRNPTYQEPTIIIVLTDGVAATGMGTHLNMPMILRIPGNELTYEPYRWDQRVFSLVLRLPGTPIYDNATGIVPRDDSPINAFCEATGGRSYCVISHRVMIQSIESLTFKISRGVVIRFKKIGFVPPSFGESECNNEKRVSTDVGDGSKLCTAAFLKVPRSLQKNVDVGFWPIPESFWPDDGMLALPQRSAHPEVLFSCVNQQPLAIENLPFDKYELEPNPMTQNILARKQPHVCWQVFVRNSSNMSEVGFPFGYLKASTSLKTVNLFVMPYNYPVLLSLLQELCSSSMKPSNDWKYKFHQYIETVPRYYMVYLRSALLRMGVSDNIVKFLLPSPYDYYLNPCVVNYLKTFKQEAKLASEKLPPTDLPVHSRAKKEVFNAFDYPRHTLVDELARLRTLFWHPSSGHNQREQDRIHSVPISKMGDYSTHLKRLESCPPLRPLESVPERASKFGNPFKINKLMCIDEADIDLTSPPSSPRSSKQSSVSMASNTTRKRGPLPLNAVYKRTCVSVTQNEIDLPLLISGIAQETVKLKLVESEDPVRSALAFQPVEDRTLVEIDVNEMKPSVLQLGVRRVGEENVKECNAKALKLAFKAVRIPGKNYEPLLKLCRSFQGSVSEKEVLLNRVIEELLRFKRKILATLVSDILKEIILDCNSSKTVQ